MSDSGFTMADLMKLKRQMDLANAVRGNGPQPMAAPQEMMPATLDGGGANPTTPYAGIANAGASLGNAMQMNNYRKQMGQMLQGLPVGSMSAQGFPDPNEGLMTRAKNYVGGLFNGG
jgi:hypothetical protein